MRYQRDQYSCGAAAVVNALRCLGKRVTENAVRSFSSTSAEKGTDEHGIIAALRGLGFEGETFESKKKDEVMKTLSSSVIDGNPVIICTQNLQHWVTVVGYIGEFFVVADPSRSKRNVEENGVHLYSPKQLFRTWQSRDGKFFGVKCSRK